MPTMNGLELQSKLKEQNIDIPVIIITGHADVPTAVKAMKAGASDFIEKPFDSDELLKRIKKCLSGEVKQRQSKELTMQAAELLSRLTRRELEVMQGLVAGNRNKEIADELFISFRTVELHRASIMKKLEAHSLSDVVRIALLTESDH